MKSIAIIPARGGSKRIPNKNIREFNGKPMIGYAIDTAKSTDLFSDILVSTDSEEIADIARSFGATVPFMRPPELADDYAGTTPVIQHAIGWQEKQGVEYDSVCCIYPTCPLLTPELIRQGYLKLLENNLLDYAFSVGVYRYPVLRALKFNEQNGVEMLFPQFAGSRSQDLSTVFHDAGQFYWGRWGAWKQGRSLFSNVTAVVELPPYRVIDIDTPDDWTIAELYFSLLQKAALPK